MPLENVEDRMQSTVHIYATKIRGINGFYRIELLRHSGRLSSAVPPFRPPLEKYLRGAVAASFSAI